MNSQHALLPLPQNYKELFAIFVTRNEFIQFEKRIDSQFMNLNEKIDALDAKVNDIHQSLDTKIDERFNTLDRKFDYKFNTLDGRMTKLETKFDDFQKNSNTQFKWLITTMLSMILVVLGVLTYFI
ncbi:hypothetical protein [Staphylococcus simulans]|uniref:hypothetical protein n=1 Tax=Staphylococcus simulans TaxID=1286 RepID=UPI003F7E91A2